MSDHTINEPDSSLKNLNACLKQLGQKVDGLTILAYQNQRLTFAYKQLILQW